MKSFAYSAAYLDEESTAIMRKFDLHKDDFHITTCFDTTRQIADAPIYSFSPKTAIVKAVKEWNVNGKILLVAELSDCDWSFELNTLMKAYGAVEDLPHDPHITLIKNATAGISENFQELVGVKLTFDKHFVNS